MFFMGRAQVHHRQYHEDEGLKRDHQDMEDRPRHIQGPLHVERQQSDEDEQHLTDIHVAEEKQPEAERPGKNDEDLEEQVERHQRQAVQRSTSQLLSEANKKEKS